MGALEFVPAASPDQSSFGSRADFGVAQSQADGLNHAG